MKILIVSGHEDTEGAIANGLHETALTETLSHKIVDVLVKQGHAATEADYNLYAYLDKNGVTARSTL